MPYVLGQAWDVPGAPVWDGTGVPFPVDQTGWPVLPDSGPVATSTAKLTMPPTAIQGAAITANGYTTPVGAVGQGQGTRTVDGVQDTPPVDLVEQGGVGSALFPQIDTTALALGDHTVVFGFVPTDANAYAPSTSPANTLTILASEDPEALAADEGYDPGEHTVAEVQAYLADNPDQTDYVLDRERAGKARTTLIGA